jgi:hypothetical protein
VELLWTILLIVAALTGTALLATLARRLHTRLGR